MEKLFKVYIGTPNRMIDINGRLVRSPVEWIVEESKIQQIQMKIDSEAINNFSITEVDPTEKKEVKITKPKTPLKQVKKQVKKPTTMLEKLTAED
ncbi:hypothetical protein KAR91_80225 [Candidatus Pacearchaeota archaeon]|nr:hypothetical protein [Candidatus Pacearchaeota archaeon]